MLQLSLGCHPEGEGGGSRAMTVVPAKAGIHVRKKHQALHSLTVGSRLRGNDACRLPGAWSAIDPNRRF